MKFLIKLNAISFLYASILFLAILLMLNVYRISRITGWSLDFIINLGIAVYIIGFILSTFLFIALARKWKRKSKTILWSIILWFPYFLLLAFINASLFPITDPSDSPFAGTGFIVMGALVFYPFYLLLINVLGTGIGVEEEEEQTFS